jgi:putative serine protease PepD
VQSQYNLTVSEGALVVSVVPGSAATQAGLKTGDVIVKINDTTISSASDVTNAVRAHQPGDVVSVHVVRGSHHRSFLVTLGSVAL